MLILQDSSRIWLAFPLFDINLHWYELSSAAVNLNANAENIRRPAVSFIPESFNFYSLLIPPSLLPSQVRSN